MKTKAQKRFRALWHSLTLAATLCTCGFSQAHAMTKKPLVVLVSTDSSPAVMGAACGIEAAARQWSNVSESRPELWLMAGTDAPNSLGEGLMTALAEGADALIIWPAEENANELPDLVRTINTLGVPVVLLKRAVEAPSEAVRGALLTDTDMLPEEVGRVPNSGSPTNADQANNHSAVYSDHPSWAPLIEQGKVSRLYVDPAEGWGREAVHLLLRKLDPAAAELLPVSDEAIAPLQFTPKTSKACNELWQRWLEQRAGQIRPGELKKR